jgi:hypothetical protein
MLNHLGDDTSGERLKLHLAMFGDLCRSVKPTPVKTGSIKDIVQCLKANEAWSYAARVDQLSSFIPNHLSISCTAERSFSALHWLKLFYGQL